MSKLIALYSPAPGCGKTTIANFLCEQRGFGKLRFANAFETMLETLLENTGGTAEQIKYYLHDHVGKEKPIPWLPGRPTGRHLKRTLGEEWGRQCNGPSFWADLWKASVSRLIRHNLPIVCDDLRRPEELDAVLELGGEAWRIDRPGYEAAPDEDGHASDGALEDYHQIWHQRIKNDGTVDMLSQYVDYCLRMVPQ